MTFEQNLEKYADLIVSIGLGLKQDDKLIIYLNQDCLPLARLISKKLTRAASWISAWNSTTTR